MVFGVADPAMLGKVKAGHRIEVEADRAIGAIAMTEVGKVRGSIIGAADEDRCCVAVDRGSGGAGRSLYWARSGSGSGASIRASEAGMRTFEDSADAPVVDPCRLRGDLQGKQ